MKKNAVSNVVLSQKKVLQLSWDVFSTFMLDRTMSCDLIVKFRTRRGGKLRMLEKLGLGG